MHIGIKLKKGDYVWTPYIEKLKSLSKITLIYDDKVIGNISEIQVLITTRISEKDIEEMKHLKTVFLYKTGMDGLPLKMLKERNIQVFPSYANADYIAEHMIAIALSLLHRVCEFDADLRNGIWYSDGNNYYWKSLSSLTAGILGYGHIGKSLAKKLDVLVDGVVVLNKSGNYDGSYKIAADIQDLIELCDILFICVPKNVETVNLIDRKLLNKMQGKYIVNVGRAEVCNEDDLYNAIESGILAGYASDVWYLSPDKMDKTKHAKVSKHSFENYRNVVMSPHCATHEIGAHERYISDAVEQCITFLEKKDDCI